MRCVKLKVKLAGKVDAPKAVLQLLAKEFVDWQRKQRSTSDRQKTGTTSVSIHSAGN